MKPYRACVVAVIVNDDGLVLAGERSDKPGIWQLPQGGVEKGETAEEALFRELQEEIGCNQVEVIKHLEEKIAYDFPAEIQSGISETYRGQLQDWFLLKLKAKASPDLSISDGEFKDLTWMSASDLTSSIVHWKKAAYEKAFAGLNLS